MKIKVKEARFAETVKIGSNQEEIYISYRNSKHDRYEMFLSGTSMLWIHDLITDEWVGTSPANLRSVTVEKNPFGEITDEISSKQSIQRVDKTGGNRKAKG